jgi:hypothetical protein
MVLEVLPFQSSGNYKMVSQLTKLMLLLLLFATLEKEYELQEFEDNEPSKISTEDWKKITQCNFVKFISYYCYRK